MVTSPYYIYDLETFKNCFLFIGKYRGSPDVHVFEMSSRKNQRSELLSWLSYLQSTAPMMVGYNSLGFDYPIIHKLLNEIHTFTFTTAYQLGQDIINGGNYGNAQQYTVPYRERIIPQVDLVKINHFDNNNKRTSLKALQFAMRSKSVEDLPYDVHTDLTDAQMDNLIKYGVHDVTETELFLEKCIHLIDFRKELLETGDLTGDVLNYSDVKIGTEVMVKRIGRAKCYSSGNVPKQTIRDVVYFKDVILPKIEFKTEEFQNVLEWFKSEKVIVKSENKPPKLEAKLAGLDFHFGVGGVHASVENKAFHSNDEFVIRDIDVTGMYVSVAVANGFYPEHLGQDFVVAYRQLKLDRDKYKKGTTKNGALKLAGNAVFGNSDNPFSPFYDPKYPKAITINGQLQILQLVESLSLIPGLDIIQANTDGITVRYPRSLEALFLFWKSGWESDTGLALEEAEYLSMFIRDVNNYLCVTKDGKIKRKGAYAYPIEDKDYEGYWNKDYSMMVVPKVIEQVLINNWKPEDVIKLMYDPFDFMMRQKTPAGATIYIGDTPMQKTLRYYASTKGEPMKKVMAAKGEEGQFKRKNKLSDEYFNSVMSEIGKGVWDERIHTKNKSVYEEREQEVEKGFLVKECNNADKFDWTDVDFDYYIKEVNKLRIGV